MVRSRILAAVAALSFAAATFAVLGAAAAAPADTLVSVGSPVTPFSQNKQNEPAVAIDAHAPNVVVAASNDEIDEESCAAGAPNDCPFTPGVGVSGVYFSFNGGGSWTQPTYTGLSARNCLGPAACTPTTGPIGKLDTLEPGPNKDALSLMCDLYALSCLESDRAWFLEHGRLSNARAKAVTAQVNELGRRVRPVAQQLVDAFGVPREMLRAELLEFPAS